MNKPQTVSLMQRMTSRGKALQWVGATSPAAVCMELLLDWTGCPAAAPWVMANSTLVSSTPSLLALLTPPPPPPTQPTLAQATYTTGLSEGDDFTALGSFEGKCGLRGQGFSSYLGGDPHKNSKFRLKAVTKPLFGE
jgi:hypothetical protein